MNGKCIRNVIPALQSALHRENKVKRRVTACYLLLIQEMEKSLYRLKQLEQFLNACQKINPKAISTYVSTIKKNLVHSSSFNEMNEPKSTNIGEDLWHEVFYSGWSSARRVLFTGNAKRGLYRLKQALPVFQPIHDYQGVPHFLCFPNETKQQLHCQLQNSLIIHKS